MSPYRWAILAVGTYSQAAASAALFGMPALGPALRDHYHLSLSGVGIAVAAMSAGMTLTLLAWGALADRYGERPIIACGLTLAAVALSMAGTLPSVGLLVACLVLAGAGGASANAASGRAIIGWFDAGERGFALGIRQTALPIGGAFGAAVLPTLSSAGGLGVAMLVLGATCLSGAAVAAAWLRDAPDRAARVAEKGPSPLRDSRIWRLSVASSLLVVAQWSLLGLLVLFLHDERGLSSRAAAGALIALQLAGAVARVAAGRWSDRRRDRIRPLATIAAACSLALLITAAAMSAGNLVVVPALLAAGVFGFAWNGLSFAAAGELAGPGRAGAALGFQNTVLALAAAVAPPVFAALVATSSWRVAFTVLAFCPATAAVALLRLAEAVPRPGGAADSVVRAPGAARARPASARAAE